MTRDEAIALRVQQLQGKQVDLALLAEALQVIQATNEPVAAGRFSHAKKGTKPRKAKQPAAPLVEPSRPAPWTLITPETVLPDPESYVWPSPETAA